MDDAMNIGVSWGMRLLTAVLVLIAGWAIGKWLDQRIKSIRKLDNTLSGFLGGFVKYSVFAVGVVAVLGQFGIQTASLLAVLGAAGLAIGLALQGTLSNVAAGTMLLILRPFKVGDYITAGGIGGTVQSLGLFGSELSTPDNVYIFLPNNKIWNADIWNYSRNRQRRQDFTIGISYDDDIDKAFKVIQKVMDNEGRLVRTEGKEPAIMVDSVGDFSINLLARVWCKSDDYWQLKWDMTRALKEALDKGGITIPFPTQIEIQRREEPQAKKKAA